MPNARSVDLEPWRLIPKELQNLESNFLPAHQESGEDFTIYAGYTTTLVFHIHHYLTPHAPPRACPGYLRPITGAMKGIQKM